MDYAPCTRLGPMVWTVPANTHRRLRALLRSVHQYQAVRRAVIFACVVTTLLPLPVAAVGLGPVTQQSALGQSLRVVIPVILVAGEDLAAECFKFASAERDADGIPQVVFGRVVVERTPSGTQLVVSNPRAVNDPVVRLTLQAGCDNAVRREYTLLMDPPAIEPPLVATDSATRNEVAASPPPVVRQPRRATGTAARASARAAPTARTTATARAARKPSPPKPRVAAKAAPKRLPPAAADRPRLQVSSAAPAAIAQKGTRTASEAEQEKAQQDLANAIEAETVVLRQRIVELTAQVDRMQKEVEANELAQRAADEAAKAAPAAQTPPPGTVPAPATAAPAETTPPIATAPPTATTPPAAKVAPTTAPVPVWWEDNTLLLAAIVGLPLLIAGGLLWKRRRDAVRTEPWRAPGAVPMEARPGPRTVTGLRNASAGVAPSAAVIATPAPSAKPVEPAGTGESATALAVSELSQVTEEARVYVELGHPERAIEVLSKHIRQNPRATPAAWIMLLDLHHANGDRQDFRRLSEEFHQHFNVQTPMWEGFGTSETGIDNGLDAFSHIVKEIVSLWRKPGCREYLEGLLYDNREGRRIGFPLAAYGDILMLLQVLDAPPVIDIEDDLAFDAKPASVRPAVPASVAPSMASVPAAAEKAIARKPMPPEPATRSSPQPIEFELELDPEKDTGKLRKPPP